MAWNETDETWDQLGEDLGLLTFDGDACVERPRLPSDDLGDCPDGTWPVAYTGLRRSDGVTRGARLLATEPGHNGALQTSFLHVRFFRESDDGEHWVLSRLLEDPIGGGE